MFEKIVYIKSHFGKSFIWPLIEAENLRGGLAGKADAKNTTRSAAEVWRFFKRHSAWPCLPKRYKFASSKVK